MEGNKKGADVGASTPKQRKDTLSQNVTNNSSRIQRLCPAVLLLATILFLVAYHKQAEHAMYLLSGVIGTTAFFEVVIHPIPDDEEDEEI